MGGKEFALKFLLLPCIILLVVLLWQREINTFSRKNALIKQPAMRNSHQQPMELSTTSSIGDVSKSNINKSESNTKTWLVVYWSTFFGTRLNLHQKWPKGECPVPCEVTSDISRAKEADGFVVHARDPKPLPPIQSVPWILQIRENPVYTPILKDAGYMSNFNLLKSYRLDSDFPDPSVLLPNLTPPTPFKNKTGLIMAALSNCEAV